jgi:hypothetical protein
MLAAILGTVTALLSLLAAALGLVNRKRIGDVHVLVNSQLTTVLDRVDQLATTLTEAGVAVPKAPPKA